MQKTFVNYFYYRNNGASSNDDDDGKQKLHQVTAAFVSNQGSNGAAEDGVGNGGAGRFRLLANQVPFTACSQQAWLMP